jgi:protein TonB
MRHPTVLLLWLAAASGVWGQEAVRVPEADAKRAAVEKVAPVYPPVARQMKLSGAVQVEAAVSDDGSVAEVKVMSGNPVLAQAVVQAVKKWRFRPFEAGGKPARAVATLSFDFARL